MRMSANPWQSTNKATRDCIDGCTACVAPDAELRTKRAYAGTIGPVDFGVIVDIH
jgi:hypothetical protein